MLLTGEQVRELADISDGASVTLNRPKGQEYVDVHLVEDGLRVRIYADGETTTLAEPNEEA